MFFSCVLFFSDNNSLLKSFYISLCIKHFGKNNINPRWNYFPVFIQAVPHKTALRRYVLAVDKVSDKHSV